MNEFLKLFLKSLGLSDASIVQIEDGIKDPEKQKTLDVKAFIDPIVAHQRTLFENDPAIVNKYSSAEKGKLMDQFDRRLKQEFGLNPDELMGKTIDEKVKLARGAAEKQFSKSGEDLQNEIIALKNENKNLKEVTIPEIESRVAISQKNFKIENSIRSMLNPEQLVGKVNGILPGLKSHLESNYLIDLDESTGGVKILDKATKLGVFNKDKTKMLTPDEIVVDYLKEVGFYKQSNADPDKKDETVVVKKEPGAKKFTSPHLQKASQNAETKKD